MGNIIGSNIFNILFILGVSSTITPIDVNVQAVADIIIAFLMCAVVFVFAKTRKSINRAEGFAMLAVYAVYMAYAIMR